MSISKTLAERCQNRCELSGVAEDLQEYEVPFSGDHDAMIVVSAVCLEQINQPEKIDPNHWRCLNDAIWSPVPAVQVMAYRMLHRLASEGWPQELLDMMYLEDDIKKWADAGLAEEDDREPTKDSNGTLLKDGDDVTIVKDLEVKGAGFTAKRGTTVKNIRLVDNPKHLEGKVNGVQVVLVAAFMKKL